MNDNVLNILNDIDFLSNMGKQDKEFISNFPYKTIISELHAFKKIKSNNYDVALSLQMSNVREYILSNKNINERDLFDIIISLKKDYKNYFQLHIRPTIVKRIHIKNFNDIIHLEDTIFTFTIPIFLLSELEMEMFPFFTDMIEIFKKGYLPCDYKRGVFYIY